MKPLTFENVIAGAEATAAKAIPLFPELFAKGIVVHAGGYSVVQIPPEADGLTGAALLRAYCEKPPATIIAVTWEAWAPRRELPLDSPLLDAIRRGRLRLRDLPPDQRREVLVIYAEQVGGWKLVEYDIEGTHPGRVLTNRREPDVTQSSTHFYPLLPANRLTIAH